MLVVWLFVEVHLMDLHDEVQQRLGYLGLAENVGILLCFGLKDMFEKFGLVLCGGYQEFELSLE